MASACCVHQISTPPVGSSTLRQQDSILQQSTGLGFKTPRLCSYNHRRLLLQSPLRNGSQRLAASALVRTIATSPESEVGATDEAEEVKEEGEEEKLVKKEEEEEEEKKKRQPKFKKKSLIHILETLHKQAIEEATKDKQIPDIRPGYVVQIRLEVPETKRRVSLLRGIVICRRNNGVNTTFTIRRIIAGVGVEMVFPLYSPNIKEITVLEKKKVRRAKLYYLRKKLARFSTF